MAIRTTVTSGIDLSNVGGSISVSSHENSGATAESAPVLLSVASDAQIPADQFASLVAAASSDLTPQYVARIMNALNEAVEDIVAASTVAPNIDLGWGKFLFEIAGSLDSASGTPGVENYCYFTGQVAQSVQRAFAQMDAYVDRAANPCDLKQIRDAATSALNTINGTQPFYADGRGLAFSSATDKQELYTLEGVKKCDLTKTAAQCYLNSLKLAIPAGSNLPVGYYIVRIESTILDKVYRMEKKVYLATAVSAPAPTVTSAHGSGPGAEEGKLSVSGGVVIDGTLLTNGTAHIKYTGTDSELHTIDVTEFQSKSATQMIISNSVWEGHAVDTTIGGKVYVTDGALTSNEYAVTFTA